MKPTEYASDERCEGKLTLAGQAAFKEALGYPDAEVGD